MADDLEGVKGNIRACIVSCKGGCISLRELTRDYDTMIGGEIPYRKFNYPSLISFLQSLPSLTVTGTGSQAMVQAFTDSSSSHISNMIAKQKTTKKRTGPPPRRGGYSSGPFRGNRGRGRGWHYPNARSYPPYRENTAPPRRQSPEFTPPPRRDFQENRPEPQSHTPLFVKVDENDKRQVSVGESSSHRDSYPNKYELPPRLKKNLETPRAPSQMQNNKSTEQTMNDNELSDLSSPIVPEDSNKIISRLGPSQLIAASRAKQQTVRQNSLPLGSVDSNIQLEDPRSAMYASSAGFQEIDSINTEVPVQEVPLPNLTNIPHNVILLLQYALARGWDEPEYKLIPRKVKLSPPPYMASVKITENGIIIKKCSSVPDEDRDVNIAKGYAAKVALEELRAEEKVKAVNTKQNSTDKSLICHRVSEIVAGVYNGLFCKRVEEIYIDRFNERLPDDWTQYLDSCPTVEFSAGISNIICPRNPAIQPDKEVVVPSLPLSELPHDILDMFITYVTSTASVWFRLIRDDFTEKYDQLWDAMESYYKNEGINEVALMIKEGHYYAAKAEDGFFRVCVCDIDNKMSMVTATLIDHGESESFSFSNLYRMPEWFCSLPKQALQCSLEGLEDFCEEPTARKIVSDSLVGKSLVASITHKDEDTGCLRVMLYDTSGSDDVNLNEKLLDEIILNSHPVLPNEGFVMEVYVTSMTKRGEVYVQLRGVLYDHVVQVLEGLSEEEISSHKLTSFRQAAINKVYLAKYAKDNNWYRAVITAVPSPLQNKIAVRFIDFGNAETVSISEIAEVDKLPVILSKLPPQAVKVTLHHLPVESLSNREIAKLHSLLLDIEKIVLIKVIKLDEESPVVEIFYKNEDDGALVSVNNTIILYRHEEQKFPKKISYDVNSYNQNLSANGHDLFYHGLDRPVLENGFIPIKVILAASPGNFYFQILKHAKDLESMMKQMQAYYEATAFPELSKEDIKKGAVYAGKFPQDGIWYRFMVTNEVMLGSNVPVRFCDYGDMGFLALSNLKDLQPEFRLLPYMAVRGKLAGVAPAHTDWSVEDCLRFQKLVVNKILVAKVVNIEDVKDDPMEMVVSINLIDTSSTDDVYISEVLINEHRAVKEIN